MSTAEGKLLNAVFPEAPCLVWTIPTSRGRVSVSTGESASRFILLFLIALFLKKILVHFLTSVTSGSVRKYTLTQFY